MSPSNALLLGNHKFHKKYIMSQDKLIKIKCTETGDILYTRKNKKGVERKLELKKFNKKLKKRTIYKETKK
jgi:ribosomal protein L33